MDGKRITVDELEEYIEDHPYKELVREFITTAFTAGAIVSVDRNGCFRVITKVPQMECIKFDGNDIVGTYMSIHGKGFSHNDLAHTWIATSYIHGQTGEEIFSDGFAIGDFPLSDGFWNAIHKSIDLAGICPFCGKRVGIENLKHVGFADKACEDCYPEAKKKIEFPGWYN